MKHRHPTDPPPPTKAVAPLDLPPALHARLNLLAAKQRLSVPENHAELGIGWTPRELVIDRATRTAKALVLLEVPLVPVPPPALPEGAQEGDTVALVNADEDGSPLQVSELVDVEGLADRLALVSSSLAGASWLRVELYLVRALEGTAADLYLERINAPKGASV